MWVFELMGLWICKFVSWWVCKLMSCRVRVLSVFREFVNQRVGLSRISQTERRVYLCWPNKDNKLLLIYGNIKPKSVARACAILFDCWAYCLFCSWRRSELHKENETGNMSTNKRKMNSRQRKQPKIIGKRLNGRLGLKVKTVSAYRIALCSLQHCM